MPQAIVRANDTMAIFCMDYLQENGYRIPEDIVVTGFDGLNDCEAYKPAITSVRRAYETSGRRAMEMMEQFWQGNMSSNSVDVNLSF